MTEKIVIKLVIIGDTNTGKTLFIQSIINGLESCDFENNIVTTGATYQTKNIIYKNKAYKLEIWDTAGREKYTSLTKIFYRDANMIFIFFNYNNKKTFERAKFLLDNVKNQNIVDNHVCILVGNKYNLNKSSVETDNIIHEEEILKYAEENNLIFAHLSISEKYSNGVIELFKKSIDEYMKKTTIHRYE